MPINLPEFAELLRQAQLFRVNEPNVTPIDEKKKKKYKIDRNKPRAWALIPSIKDFGIELRPYDWLLQLFKLKRKWKPQLSFTTWYNDGSNIYLDYMFNRLTQQVKSKQYDRARITMWQLMDSSVYQVSALNHVLKNWHRNLSLKQVKWVLRDVKKLVKRKDTALKYARVYLHEANKIRPLGVPSMSWRIYLHMYNNCLVEWRTVTEQGKQHGYLPQKGVITAWFEIVKRLNLPNIYEADFKNFFGSVQHSGLEIVLRQIGLPQSEIHFIHDLNKSQPKLEKVDEIEEFKTRQYNYISECLAKEIPPEGKYWEPIRQTIIDAFGTDDPRKSDLLLMCLEEGNGEYWDGSEPVNLRLLKYVEIQWALLSSFGPSTGQFHGLLQGVPQGAPTSCSLATLALRSIEAKLDVVIYADDLICFPESSDWNPTKELTDVVYGIELNEAKSKWIKKDGIWLVDSFKFLGIVYFTPRLRKQVQNWIVQRTVSLAQMLQYKIPTDLNLYGGKFRAATRKGADLEFTSKESFISYLATAREILLDSPYLLSVWKSKSLKEWLETREIQWGNLILNRAKLLFSETFREIAKNPEGKLEKEERVITLGPNPSIQDYELWIGAKSNMETLLSSPHLWMGKKGLYEEWRQIYEKIIKDKTFVVKRYRNPLSGYFVAKMFNNHWTQNVKQKFGLSYISSSWVGERWGSYSWEWILPRHSLTIFIASSFACHDLIRYASGLSAVKAKKSVIRRVSCQKSIKSDLVKLSVELVHWKSEYLRKIHKSGAKSKFYPV